MKLIVVIMGQDCANTIGMCLQSVKNADKIIYLDGGSSDNTLGIVGNKAKVLHNKFDKANQKMINIQRRFYLDYLKKNHLGDICLVLDADEVVDDLSKFLEWKDRREFVVSPHMRHLMYTLGFEDATSPVHFVFNRFFHITEDIYYPEGEHAILQSTSSKTQGEFDGLVWHLGYLGGAWDVKKRYDQQKLRDYGHTKEFLDNWNKTHMTGNYPISRVNLVELPEVILDNFGINKDQLYFEGRGLEMKHAMMVKQWNEFFKPTMMHAFGCGRGPYLYFWEQFCRCYGMEINDYAIKHKFCNSEILKYDITKGDENEYERGDLSTAIDVLEHIEYDKLDFAIQEVIDFSSKHILISVPVIGDPNLENDPTHIIKETKDWWKKQFTDKGLKEVEVPEHFLYRDQLLIFTK